MKISPKSQSSYEIIIGEDLKIQLESNVKYCIVTDSNLKNHTSKFSLPTISFPAGERSKNITTLGSLTEQCLHHNIDRKSVLIAFGGGIVGDITGFLAGTYMRGINFIQIPTSLLAMVDSSIGGKVGVNVGHGKNISGLFYHPQKVYVDISYLKTLPLSELKNGLVEVIKYGIIYDGPFFAYLEKNLDKILRLDRTSLIKIITRSCEIKADVVKEDERESNLRMILNHGHTIGHAIESSLHYKLPHGQAVAHGIIIECKIANQLKLLTDQELSRVESLIGRLDFTTPNLNPKRILALLKHDKKSFNNNIRFALPTKIGNVTIKDNVPEKIITQVLK